EDIAKLDTWSPLHRGLLRSPRRAHVGRGEVPSRRRAAGLGTGSQLRLLRSASRVKLTHYRWLTPWTPYPSRGRLLAAHDERLLPLPHHLPDPPRPGGLGPLPRSGMAAPRLLRASRSPYRAGGARGAAGADDYPPRLVRPLRPSPAAGAGDAAHLALRLGQRRP